MKISTKGRYGLRVMTDIAVNTEQGGLVSLKDIAEREAYLEKVKLNGWCDLWVKEDFGNNA